MKKWEACHALGELRKDIEDYLERAKETLSRCSENIAEKATAEKISGMQLYGKREVDKFTRWLKALDVAGDALTKGR